MITDYRLLIDDSLGVLGVGVMTPLAVPFTQMREDGNRWNLRNLRIRIRGEIRVMSPFEIGLDTPTARITIEQNKKGGTDE